MVKLHLKIFRSNSLIEVLMYSVPHMIRRKENIWLKIERDVKLFF